MSTDDFPAVSVWELISPGAEYALVGSIINYDGLDFTPKHLEAGEWEMHLPFDVAAQSVSKNRLYTIDWRGHRTTWLLDSYTPHNETGREVKLKVGGPSALALLARELAWPLPSQPLSSQPTDPDAPGPRVTAPAGTVIRDVVQANWVTRRGESLTTTSGGGLGSTVQSRPLFDNLLEYVSRKARTGGVSLDINLVNITSTRAVLELQVEVPADLTSRVRLSEKVGNLGSWTESGTEPTATKAIVTGAGGGTSRIFREVTTPESVTAAAEWGGHRVIYVQGPASYDDPDLDQAGEEALAEGAGTVTLTLEASDTEGLMAFRDYNVGDRVTGELNTGLETQDVISSIKVTVSDGYPQVTATFGNPNTQDEEPIVSVAERIRFQDRRIRLLEQRN